MLAQLFQWFDVICVYYIHDFDRYWKLVVWKHLVRRGSCRISFDWTARCFFLCGGAAVCCIFLCFRINMKHGVPVHIHARVFVPLFHQRPWSAYFLECGGSHRAWNFFRYLCSLWGVCLLQAKTSSDYQSCFGMTPQPAVSACVLGFGTWVANNLKYDNDYRLPTVNWGWLPSSNAPMGQSLPDRCCHDVYRYLGLDHVGLGSSGQACPIRRKRANILAREGDEGEDCEFS